ncbi:NADPH quinone oxidoreductase/ARE-binding protein [Schizosaccharomyces japonicus yFS275]|uniref:Probable quinone oxidoreductase n=1 Tax=Schizosaccharomyces japonicus (strain yFS275 / FY16936) TaxID=402676 RepID=B6K4C2_SCHJY|nr:NADPH quinone oxidoreductase/ARE-binding protein [Schizosaccharomyces japonicus yFS275]EEB08329.1 NADPH quinone oxidoreductase/ARE-binding protein [Schizosaccharomyces japonicus yFS275]
MNHVISYSKTGSVDVLEYKEAPIPSAGPHQVLVKNAYAGVNYVDTYFREGLYEAALPSVLGIEGAGVVESLGEEVTDFKVGDRVVYMTMGGSYAQYTAAYTLFMAKIPDEVSFETACASLVQGLTAYMLITHSYNVQKDDWVVVYAAAGGVGSFMCQMLKHRGAHVIAVTSTEEKGQMAVNYGAECSCRYDKLAETVREKTNGKGVRAVFDSIGKDTLDLSLDILALEGRFVSFGNASGPIDNFSLNRLQRRCLKVTRPGLLHFFEDHESFANAAQALFDEITNNGVKVSIFKEYPMSEAKQAHLDIQSRKTTGKLLLKC